MHFPSLIHSQGATWPWQVGPARPALHIHTNLFSLKLIHADSLKHGFAEHGFESIDK